MNATKPNAELKPADQTQAPDAQRGFDQRPRRLTEQQREALSDLALMVSTLLESRKVSSEAAHIGQILNYAFDEIIMLDPRTFKIQFVNSGAQESLGRSQSELLHMDLRVVVAGYPLKELEELSCPAGDNLDHGPVHDGGSQLWFEAQHARKDGSCYPVEVRAVVIGGAGMEQLILLANDISKRRRTERLLEEIAVNDSVTRLPNRYHFEARLEAAMRHSRAAGGPVALMLIEIDSLREIRHGYGQRIADNVLSEFGERLRRCVGASDLVAHLGGGEFAGVLEDYYDADKPRDIAVLINDALELPFWTAKGALQLKVRIGITFFEECQETVEAFLGRADEAVNEAALSGVRLCVLQSVKARSDNAAYA